MTATTVTARRMGAFGLQISRDRSAADIATGWLAYAPIYWLGMASLCIGRFVLTLTWPIRAR